MWQDLLRVDCNNSDDLQIFTFGDCFNQNLDQVQLPDELRRRSNDYCFLLCLSCIQAMEENAYVLTMAQVKSTTKPLAMWTILRAISVYNANCLPEEALHTLLDGMARL